MITEILKSLSDTEIMVIAEELRNPEVDENMVYHQLVAKGNEGQDLEDIYGEVTSDNVRGTLPRMVAFELAQRLRETLLRL